MATYNERMLAVRTAVAKWSHRTVTQISVGNFIRLYQSDPGNFRSLVPYVTAELKGLSGYQRKLTYPQWDKAISPDSTVGDVVVVSELCFV